MTVLNRRRDLDEGLFDLTLGRRADGAAPEVIAPDGWDVVPPAWGIHTSVLLDAGDRLAMLAVWDRVTAAYDELGAVAWT